MQLDCSLVVVAEKGTTLFRSCVQEASSLEGIINLLFATLLLERRQVIQMAIVGKLFQGRPLIPI